MKRRDFLGNIGKGVLVAGAVTLPSLPSIATEGPEKQTYRWLEHYQSKEQDFIIHYESDYHDNGQVTCVVQRSFPNGRPQFPNGFSWDTRNPALDTVDIYSVVSFKDSKYSRQGTFMFSSTTNEANEFAEKHYNSTDKERWADYAALRAARGMETKLA